MNNMNRVVNLIIALVFFCLYGFLRADDIYISQSGNGEMTNSVEWLNNSTNWGVGVGKISPGDIVHITGVITNNIIIGGSGNETQRITIYFEKGAKMSSPYWLIGPASYDGGAITIYRKNYITIDGGIDGTIEGTNNGSGMLYSAWSEAINATSASFLTIQNLRIENLYVREYSTNIVGLAAIQNTAKTGSQFSDFVVTNCTIHDTAVGIEADYSTGCSNYTFVNNTIYRVNCGIKVADRNINSSISKVRIAGNTISKLSNWDGADAASRNAYHHECVYCYCESGGSFSNLTINNNRFGPDYSNTTPNGSTAGLFLSGDGLRGQIYLYNNIFLEETNSPANGSIYIWTGMNSDVYVLNNTFIGYGAGIAIGYNGSKSGRFSIKNNIGTRKNYINIFLRADSIFDIDYNLGYDLVSAEEYSYSTTSSSSFKTFSQWQSLGFDLHGSIANPLFAADYSLLPGSPAIGVGTNLSSIFTTDILGNPRGSSWDIGAYQYVSPTATYPPQRIGRWTH